MKAQRRDDADRALKVIESIPEDGERARAYAELAGGALRTKSTARRLEVLGQALSAIRAIKDPNQRIYQLAEVAGAMIELGARKEAGKLLADERPAVEAVGLSVRGQGQCRLHYAKPLARVDLPAALEILGTSRLEDQEANGGKWHFVFERTYRELAEVLAADDPAAALRVLRLLRTDAERDDLLPLICYALATTDRAAAERLASAIHPSRVHLRPGVGPDRRRAGR